MNDELMTGRNPSADNRLAADLGVKIKPEEQDEVPPVVLGNAGYETDASGEAIDSLRSTFDWARTQSAKLERTGTLLDVQQILLNVRGRYMGYSVDNDKAFAALGEAMDEVQKLIDTK